MSEIDIYWLRARLRKRLSELLNEEDHFLHDSIGLAYLRGIGTVLSLLVDITGIPNWWPKDFDKSGFRE